jgi:hypothetical protein
VVHESLWSCDPMEISLSVVRANEAETTRIVGNGDDFRLIRPDLTMGNLELMRLQQAQLPGARHGFGAALHLELVKDDPVVSFNRIQSQEESLADLLI